MNGIIRVLKADLKVNIDNFVGAAIGLLIGVGLISIFMAKTVMAEEGISFQEFFSVIIVIMMLFVICITLTIGQAQSLSESYPIASKLGNKRSDIAFGLILKDILISVLAGIIIYLVSNLLLSNIRIDMPEAFGKITTINFVTNFVLGISSISLIASSIAYILKIEPIIGSGFGIIFDFTIFLNGNIINIMNIAYINNMYLVIALFIIGQILRFYIINKFDTRF